MLNSISWSDYFLAVFILICAYYLITVLLLYSSEIKNLLTGKGTNNTGEKVHQSTDILGTTSSVLKSLSRNSQSEDRTHAVEKSIDPEHPIPKQPADEVLTGTVSDLLEEIKTRVNALQGWNKDESLPAIREVLSKYIRLTGTPYQESINIFIANLCNESFSWQIESDEVQALWP